MKQLNTLYKFELEKEQKASQALQAAELDYQQNQDRLKNVSDYRLEYMRRLNQRSLEGIDSATYSHFHAFIAKLDNAAQQVKIAVHQAKALVETRKKQWLEQRRKIQAVELLRDKKLAILALAANKQEQKMFDEIATQQYVRRNR
ncbi:flagellar export protein FliJ [Colwellia polaris]|jgi:flagellar FliJ protein|uniref:flagellar export protein FliJ n=1 Tax=Colwellia polaris TaxID=326537 RepID=UPI000A1737B9|nr:flagellar export protein FliJ [Colwellia polaris]